VKKFLFLLCMMMGSVYAQTEDPKTYYNIPDDGYAIVPIPFGFPYYGKLFTHSIFFDNGVVSFYDPLSEAARLGGQQYWAEPLNNNIGSQFYYSIMPLWTDLRGDANSRYYTQSDNGTYLKYTWENVQQWGYSDRPNTFSLDINKTGAIGIQYHQINIGDYPVTAGMVGNASLGEWTQIYHRPSGGYTSTGDIPNWGVAGTLDCSSALNDPSCPGYAEAYFAQQCTISALYSTTCPGYATAYYDYQCSLDPLYHTGCLGYDQAYFDQQCSLDALYSTQCPNYADAYYVQQCTINPLYDSGCTGYAEAYALNQLLNSPVVETSLTKESETVALVSDPAVNEVITATATSVSPAQAATTTVPLAPMPAPVISADTTKKEKKDDTKTSTSESATTTSTASSSEKKDEPKTNRQALAERRLAAARAKAIEQGKNLANEMGNATTLEAQVAVQNVVLSAMGFVPGFDAYGKATILDGVGYKPFTVYNNQTNVDNARVMRGLSGASDRLHSQMVDQQYR
jgi:hypothetical protein